MKNEHQDTSGVMNRARRKDSSLAIDDECCRDQERKKKTRRTPNFSFSLREKNGENGKSLLV
ncbi:hypothetical protein Csa_021087 [Cucumis sativus]|uniref:Uncharacterized protein n=1 Tax=Cucumis sativus TaxID=3659 RepID=A0A0A0KCY6_CUCSA|nr:hypothetical protein Csa_021087 [Cucumis sativus]